MAKFYTDKAINDSYASAKEAYAAFGVDTDAVLEQLGSIRISLHCWQGDDVSGFEAGADGLSGGGIMATGNYPGRARNGDELRADLDRALSLIPGKHRLNLHAIYAETDGRFVDRDALGPEHFSKWIDWAKNAGIGLDFNPTFFSHEKADSGYTLSSKDESIRRFWIEHAKRSREIAAFMGRELGTPCVNNLWIPDGSKDLTPDRLGHREILREALDEILSERFDKKYLIDAVESKLFGIGSESYVVGSHEFYMAYALTRDVTICLDMGHFHPTESIADKISSLLAFSRGILLHVSRGVRWDSDHVVIFNDDIVALAQELKRCGAYGKAHIGLDFFDASINRLAAWVIGTRSALKAILFSLLEPTQLLLEAEDSGDLGRRLGLLEEFKTLPYGAVWNKYCLEQNTPAGADWLADIKDYEEKILGNR